MKSMKTTTKVNQKTKKFDAQLNRMIRLAKTDDEIREEVIMQYEIEFARKDRDLREVLNEVQSDIDFFDESLNASDALFCAKHLLATSLKDNVSLKNQLEQFRFARDDLMKIHSELL
jgi:hypothetical protein